MSVAVSVLDASEPVMIILSFAHLAAGSSMASSV